MNATRKKEMEAEKEFAAFLSKKRILIADTQAASRVGLSRALIGLGARANLVVTVDSYDVAREFLGIHKPHIVFCEYDLGLNCGLQLLSLFRETRPDEKDTLFVLVTGNTSQSAVAEAAEKDVDLYILKPYNVDTLRNALSTAVKDKLEPTDYVKTILEGKQLLSASKPHEAMAVFERAMQMSPKPTLAYYYLGETHRVNKSVQIAKMNYLRGLEYNILHYKCLTGLYEALMEQGQTKEAYNVLKRITRYFPANPTRLSQVLRLAVMTGEYEDIEHYYEQFLNVEKKSPELVRHICAAVIVTAKYLLKKGEITRGLKLFHAAALTAGTLTQFLSEIILSLVDMNFPEEAEKVLKRFPPELESSRLYRGLDLLITSKLSSLSLTVSKGRQLIREGVYDPLVFRVIIESSARAGLKHSAEALADRAAKIWPDRKMEFSDLATQTETDPSYAKNTSKSAE